MKFSMKNIMLFAAALLLSVPAWGQSFVAPVILPDLPVKIDFAGEKVPLNNFDTYESLQREMLVTSYMHSRTMLTLLNSKRYFAIIEPILTKNGIPSDFKYLCMAESGLNPGAVSTAKAAGLWQIMPATGKSFGLYIDSEVDERYDIEKATEVACQHLLKSYRQFGSWTLAAAAYNLGDAGVSRRLERQGVGNNYYDMFLPEETMRYLFRILSFKILCDHPQSYGYMIKEGDYYKPLTDYTIISVSSKDIDWSKFAAEHGTTYKMLRQLNHWIRDYGFVNKEGKSFQVKIPNQGFRKQ